MGLWPTSDISSRYKFPRPTWVLGKATHLHTFLSFSPANKNLGLHTTKHHNPSRAKGAKKENKPRFMTIGIRFPQSSFAEVSPKTWSLHGEAPAGSSHPRTLSEVLNEPESFSRPNFISGPYSRLSFHPGIELHLHAENALPPTGSREAGYLPEVPCCDGLIN